MDRKERLFETLFKLEREAGACATLGVDLTPYVALIETQLCSTRGSRVDPAFMVAALGLVRSIMDLIGASPSLRHSVHALVD
ncbi:MAG: hypothetical protein FWD57_08060 [Polyangiaceae bacterium]|nr:hypothetical protein [Polyangiaceae bacterium]